MEFFEKSHKSPLAGNISRWGKIMIAGHRTPVYFLQLNAPTIGKIKITVSEAGEFLEMKTPFGYDLKSKVVLNGKKGVQIY